MGSSRGAEAVATSIAFVAIAGATVATRVFVRLYLVSNWGADDALVVCSLAMSIALTILIKLRMWWFPFAGTYGYLHTSQKKRMVLASTSLLSRRGSTRKCSRQAVLPIYLNLSPSTNNLPALLRQRNRL